MVKTRTRTIVLVATGAVVTALVAAPSTASAATPHSQLHVVKTISSDFVGPLQFAVAGRYVLVADAFTSTLNLVGRDAPIATGPDPQTGGDLAGIAVNVGRRSLAYTSANGDHSVTSLTILQAGKKPVVADLSGFERRHNPDGKIEYGVPNPTKCVADALEALGAPVKYRGQIDSHPYAVAALPNGAWAVADAGGNDLLRVDRWGHISVISVLPSQTVKITKTVASALGLPDCAIGFRYRFEAVPTDVEVGRHGSLFVTTLPGGPEGPGNVNPGSVYRVDRWSHTAHRVATGFAGATNLAIDSHGTIYVAEIGAGRISKVVHGRPKLAATLPFVVAVEFANGHLYASTAPAASGGDGPGTVVQLGYGRSAY